MSFLQGLSQELAFFVGNVNVIWPELLVQRTGEFASLDRLSGTPAAVYDRCMPRPGPEAQSGPLFGRERECAAVDELLAASARGESGSLVVRGEAGVGKTALLTYAAESGGDRTVLRVAGVEAEADLGFAGLDGLLRPVMDKIGDLPEAQVDALSGALGLAPTHGADRFLVSAATLSLLAAAADERPLLCVIDDVQFLDLASAEALVFAARRLAAEPVAMIFAVREGAGREFRAPSLPELFLGGLSPESARRLLETSAPTAAEPVQEWLLARAAGNPLALLELPAALSASQLQGRAALPETTPLTAGLRAAFAQRIDRLPAETRTALLIAALDDREELATVMRAAAEAGLPEDALDPAEREGLLSIAGGGFEFRHPLVRSALLESTTHSEQRSAHLALASALNGGADADRRAWHHALASVAADEDVAGALEASARRYEARGGHASASAAFVRAAELSADDGNRIRRLAAASDAAWAAGQPESARELIARALPLATGELRPKLLYLRGVIEARTRDDRGAVAMLVEAADASEDGSFTLEALTLATEAAMYAGDDVEAANLGARASGIEPTNATDRFRVAALGGVAAALAGDYERAAPLLLEATQRAGEIEDPHVLVWAARAASIRSTPRDGLPHAARAVTIARERSMLSVLPVALSHQASGLIGHGRFKLAYVAAEEAIGLASDFGHQWGVGRNLANIAMLDAVRGDEPAARAHADEARELAANSGALLIGEFAESALGVLELTLGRPSEATDRLLVVSDSERAESNRLTGLWSIPDLIEGAARSGRLDETVDRFERYSDWVNQAPTETRMSLLARCRALMGEGEARDEFETALAGGAAISPFERARTELLYGEWLRRGRQRREARGHLRSAAELFRQVAAPTWEERAEGELRATGEKARKRDPSTLDELTPQELQIAGLVASGMTNRQIAEQLYLSPRTIDYHLRKIFSKLGVASRTELVQMGVPEQTPA
jgi:DNA-binding CsgD family transcriptional regulator